jgi:hypothetical protein
MAVGTVSGIDPQDNWQLVGSQAMSGLTTYTFSSLTGYKTYWMVGKGLTNATSDLIAVRINGDSSSASYVNFWATSGAGAYFLVSPDRATSRAFAFEINNADKSLPHSVKSSIYASGYPTTSGDAYIDPTPVTSITVSAYSGNAFNGGTVYLYGIPA